APHSTTDCEDAWIVSRSRCEPVRAGRRHPGRQVHIESGRQSMHPRSLLSSAVLALAVTGLVALAEKDEKPKATKYDSPEAVYKAAAAAAKKNDMKTFAGCLATESLEAMAGGMAIGGAMMVKFADAFDKTGK